MELVVGLAIPFLGTTLGSAMVFFMKNKMTSAYALAIGFVIMMILDVALG